MAPGWPPQAGGPHPPQPQGYWYPPPPPSGWQGAPQAPAYPGYPPYQPHSQPGQPAPHGGAAAASPKEDPGHEGGGENGRSAPPSNG